MALAVVCPGISIDSNSPPWPFWRQGRSAATASGLPTAPVRLSPSEVRVKYEGRGRG